MILSGSRPSQLMSDYSVELRHLVTIHHQPLGYTYRFYPSPYITSIWIIRKGSTSPRVLFSLHLNTNAELPKLAFISLFTKHVTSYFVPHNRRGTVLWVAAGKIKLWTSIPKPIYLGFSSYNLPSSAKNRKFVKAEVSFRGICTPGLPWGPIVLCCYANFYFGFSHY